MPCLRWLSGGGGSVLQYCWAMEHAKVGIFNVQQRANYRPYRLQVHSCSVRGKLASERQGPGTGLAPQGVSPARNGFAPRVSRLLRCVEHFNNNKSNLDDQAASRSTWSIKRILLGQCSIWRDQPQQPRSTRAHTLFHLAFTLLPLIWRHLLETARSTSFPLIPATVKRK